MTNDEYKQSIQYKSDKKLVKLIGILCWSILFIFSMVFIISCINLYPLSPFHTIAFLIAGIFLFLLADLPLIFYFFYLLKKLKTSVDYALQSTLVEARIDGTCNTALFQSKFIVSFEINQTKLIRNTEWVHNQYFSSYDFSKKILIGYIEKQNKVIVIREIND